MIKKIIVLLFVVASGILHAQDTLRSGNYSLVWDTLRMKERPDWSEHFKSQNVSVGTLVIYDQQKGKYQVFNRERMIERFLPASTFKIMNSLIALETGVVKNEKVTFKWDGFDRGVASWNQDQNMEEAFKNSTVWYYQQLARKIGFKKMDEYVKQAGYGNKNIDGGLDDFWLKGKLRINAKEQVDLLKKLQADLLPFKKENQAIVRKIMIEEKSDTYILRSKTGWAEQDGKNIGWYVGYVERPKLKSKDEKSDYYYFALNIEMDPNKPEVRKTIVRRVLSELKILN